MELERATRFIERHISSAAAHLRDPAGLRHHCQGVSRASRAVAEALAAAGLEVDADVAAVMGMIHDVGRGVAGDDRHGIEGYWLAAAVGHPPGVARVCVTHMSMGRAATEAVAAGLLDVDDVRRLAAAGVILEQMSHEEQIVGVMDPTSLKGSLCLWLNVSRSSRNAEARYLPAIGTTSTGSPNSLQPSRRRSVIR